MKAAIWARVTLRSGQKPLPLPQPVVIASSAMRSMNGAWKPAASTSSNRLTVAGRGSAPSRTLTIHTAIVLRSMGAAGQKPSSHSVPAKTPRAVSSATGTA